MFILEINQQMTILAAWLSFFLVSAFDISLWSESDRKFPARAKAAIASVGSAAGATVEKGVEGFASVVMLYGNGVIYFTWGMAVFFYTLYTNEKRSTEQFGWVLTYYILSVVPIVALRDNWVYQWFEAEDNKLLASLLFVLIILMYFVAGWIMFIAVFFTDMCELSTAGVCKLANWKFWLSFGLSMGGSVAAAGYLLFLQYGIEWGKTQYGKFQEFRKSKSIF